MLMWRFIVLLTWNLHMSACHYNCSDYFIWMQIFCCILIRWESIMSFVKQFLNFVKTLIHVYSIVGLQYEANFYMEKESNFVGWFFFELAPALSGANQWCLVELNLWNNRLHVSVFSITSTSLLRTHILENTVTKGL